jgi:hypothetical protein
LSNTNTTSTGSNVGDASTQGNEVVLAQTSDRGSINDDGLLQIEVRRAGLGEVENPTPSSVIVAGRQGPAASDNILHHYSSYTYKISLMVWETVQDYEVDIRSTWQDVMNSGMKGKKTLFSSGGQNNSDRDSEFDLDFYIDSLKTESAMGMSGDTRSANVFSVEMDIIEPTGTTLLERMRNILPREQWAEFPFLIKIEFIGWRDDNSKTPTIIAPATRFIPVRLSKLDFSVVGGATVYKSSWIAISNIEKNHPRSTLTETQELYGKNVKDFCDQLATIFNNKEKARIMNYSSDSASDDINPSKEYYYTGEEEILDSVRSREVPDSIEFVIHPTIAEREISPIIVDHTMLNKKDTITTKSGARTPPEQYKYQSTIRIDNQNKLIRLDKGTSMIVAVEKFLLFSTYITDQLNEPGIKDLRQILKNPTAGLKWWKITLVPVFKEWDCVRNTYARHTIIQIDPYSIPDPMSTDSSALPEVARNYQYIFTGQNIDIKEMNLDFNIAFAEAVASPQFSQDQNLNVKGSNKPAYKAGCINDKASILGTSQIEKTQRVNSSDTPETGKEEVAATLLENLYRKQGYDFLVIDLAIVGDPAYIQQDGVINLLSENKAGFALATNDINPSTDFYSTANDVENNTLDPFNGAILPDAGDVHIFTSFRTPDDYDEEAGLVNFGSSDNKYKTSVLSGFYKVITVKSAFSQGEFSQVLTCQRLYNQYPENKFNSSKLKKNPVGGQYESYESRKVAELTYPIVTGSPVINTIAAAAALAALGSGSSNKSNTTLRQKQEALNKEVRTFKTDRNYVSYGYTSNNTRLKERPESLTISYDGPTNTQNSVNFEQIDTRTIKSKEAARIKADQINNPVVTPTISDQYSRIGGGINDLTYRLDRRGTITAGTPLERTTVDQVATGISITESNNLSVSDIDISRGVTTENNIATVRPYNKPGRDFYNSNGQVQLALLPTMESGISPRDHADNILVSNNLSRGVIGTEALINTSLYSDEDQISISENTVKINKARESLILSSNNEEKKEYYQIANSLSEQNRTIHNKYDNVSYSWDEMGYFPNLQ